MKTPLRLNPLSIKGYEGQAFLRKLSYHELCYGVPVFPEPPAQPDNRLPGTRRHLVKKVATASIRPLELAVNEPCEGMAGEVSRQRRNVWPESLIERILITRGFVQQEVHGYELVAREASFLDVRKEREDSCRVDQGGFWDLEQRRAGLARFEPTSLGSPSCSYIQGSLR